MHEVSAKIRKILVRISLGNRTVHESILPKDREVYEPRTARNGRPVIAVIRNKHTEPTKVYGANRAIGIDRPAAVPLSYFQMK